MRTRQRILFTGARHLKIETLENHLRAQPGLEVATKYFSPQYASLAAVLQETGVPDVLVLSLGPNVWEMALRQFPAEQIAETQLIVIGPPNDMGAVRRAMQTGARDYLPHSTTENEFLNTVKQLTRAKKSFATPADRRRITSVINTKGGSGASFIAGNLAHIMASKDKLRTALIDLDLQFGIQSLNFDVPLQHSLREVLDASNQLDAVALQGYMTKHESGLHLLGEKLDKLVLSHEIDIDAVERLLNLLASSFDHVILDLPRQIDALFSTVMAASWHVVLVTQQSVAHVRDTKRLLSILRQEFELPSERITALVNRHDEKNAITLNDIARTLEGATIIALPNDYKRAALTIDTARPMFAHAPNAPLTQKLIELSMHIRGATSGASARKGIFGKTFGFFGS